MADDPHRPADLIQRLAEPEPDAGIILAEPNELPHPAHAVAGLPARTGPLANLSS